MIANKKKVTQIHESYIQAKEQEERMMEKRRRGLFRRLIVLGSIGVILAAIFTVTLVSQTMTLHSINEEQAALQEQLEALQAEQARLEQDIENYNDLNYIADIARKDYYLTKPGETLFRVPEKSSD
ncbi:septum formation initiator family protein [Aliibacillus thermotolerans]|uniref:Septum formation initiator family protein n=1 Tax=Aliibacillus thermotolerans TaxID=1834418 RepID=A0ABW0U8C8_9BACI|nr:septum formation initiator family protein [Aliibacillus thermotolerans]